MGIINNQGPLEERQMSVTTDHKSVTTGVSAFETPKKVEAQITIIPAAQVEKQFISDNLEAQKRRFAVAYLAYCGDTAKIRRTGFTDVEIQKYLKDPGVKEALEKGACWTREEIVAKISMEAEMAPRPQDRLNALRMLMEYRGISEPQGGQRSFERLILGFKKQ